MKKIRLDLESLKVESFVTSHADKGNAGTVFGMGNTYCEATCNEISFTCNGVQGGCPVSDTCDWTYPEATTCTAPGNTDGCTILACNTQDWTCDPCVASCNSEECKTE